MKAATQATRATSRERWCAPPCSAPQVSRASYGTHLEQLEQAQQHARTGSDRVKPAPVSREHGSQGEVDGLSLLEQEAQHGSVVHQPAKWLENVFSGRQRGGASFSLRGVVSATEGFRKHWARGDNATRYAKHYDGGPGSGQQQRRAHPHALTESCQRSLFSHLDAHSLWLSIR